MLEIKQNTIKVINKIIDTKCCPFLDDKCEGCHPDCICRFFDNTNISCYEIAKKIKNDLISKKMIDIIKL